MGRCVVSGDGHTRRTTAAEPAPGEPAASAGVADAPGADLAEQALARARGMLREGGAPGARASSVDPRAGGTARRRARARRNDISFWSTAGPDPERDPQALRVIAAAMVLDRGWQRPLTEARLFTDWPVLVGTDLAAHCVPTGLRDGELRLSAQSTAWATQVRLLGPSLLARLNTELGAGVVTRLTVTGPTGPSWKHGYRSVPGAHGPRDTYG